MIDPSIALQYKPVEVANPLQSYAQALSLKNLATQSQTAQLELQQRQQALAQNRAINDAYKRSVTVGADGAADIDTGQLSSTLAAAGAGSRLPEILEGLNKYKKSAADLVETNGKIAGQQADFGGTIGATVKSANNDPHLFLTLAQDALNKKAINPQTAAPYLQAVNKALADDPTGAAARQIVGQISEHLIAGSPAQQKLLNERMSAQGSKERGDAALTDATNNTTRTEQQVRKEKTEQAARLLSVKDPVQYAQNYGALSADPFIQAHPDLLAQFDAPAQFNPEKSPAKAADIPLTAEQRAQLDLRAKEVAKLTSQAELAQRAAQGDPVAQRALDLLKQNNIEERKASQTASAPVVITPEGYNMLGEQYRTTGQLPTFGRGPAGQIQANIVNQTGAATNGQFNPGATKAEFHADSASLTSLQKQRDAVVTFEKTAGANLDQFVKLAQRLPDSGTPWVNTPLRLLNDKLVGNEWAPAVNAARAIANNEIAKVTSNPGLAGALSDSARHEVAEYNPQNATLKQTLHLAQVLRQDMANRRKFFDEGIAEIKGRIGHSSTPATPAPGAPKVGTVDGGYRFKGGDPGDKNNWEKVS
jgi:hypothetical protein